MFIQVIQARTSDAAGVRAAMDRWVRELAPGATGWLGSTAGVTPDGRFIAVVRFESAEAADGNSGRPEQDAWWQQTARLFDGDATFRNSTRVDVDVVGDPAEAGFVQVIQGRTSDPDRARQLMTSAQWSSFRPEILGSLTAEHEGGYFTTAIFFTSEAEAREGERREPPAELREEVEEMNALTVGAPEFWDLPDPWLHAPS